MAAQNWRARTPKDREIDRYIGARVRFYRDKRGLTLQQVADALEVSFQQAWRYERGLNSLGGSGLYEMARVLGVSVYHLYEGLPGQEDRTARPLGQDALAFADAVANIEDPVTQRRIRQLLRARAALVTK